MQNLLPYYSYSLKQLTFRRPVARRTGCKLELAQQPNNIRIQTQIRVGVGVNLANQEGYLGTDSGHVIVVEVEPLGGSNQSVESIGGVVA